MIHARIINRPETAEDICQVLPGIPGDWLNILLRHYGFTTLWFDIDHRQGRGTIVLERGLERIRYSYDGSTGRQWAEVSW